VADFERRYGDGRDLVYADGTRTPAFMWHAARAFFANGGRRLYVARAWRDDGLPLTPEDLSAALEPLDRVDEIAIVAAPGATAGYEKDPKAAAARVRTLLAHAARVRRFAVIDSGDDQPPGGVEGMRASFDSAYGALYYPWVRMADPTTGREVVVPPSGFVCGVYARVDSNRGVWKAPANEALVMAVGLERDIPATDLARLTEAHVNCLRHVRGKGLLVWGARTLSSDPEWKYVNVRRLLLFVESSLSHGTNWAIFEPNGEPLWASVRRAAEDFLVTQWRAGALAGSRPDEAFFVRCDRTTMTQNDLDNGRLICLVGVAPVRPAEFVIFRIGQWTLDRRS